jgi:hypothetical protein
MRGWLPAESPYYSLFLREDGLLGGYLETPDFAAAAEGFPLAGRLPVASSSYGATGA